MGNPSPVKPPQVTPARPFLTRKHWSYIIAGIATGSIAILLLIAFAATQLNGFNSGSMPGLPAFSSKPSGCASLDEMESLIRKEFDVGGVIQYDKQRGGEVRGGQARLVQMKGKWEKIDEARSKGAIILSTDNIMSLWVIRYENPQLAAIRVDEFASRSGVEWNYGCFIFGGEREYIDKLKRSLK